MQIITFLTHQPAILNLLTLGLYGWLQGRKLVRPCRK